MAQLDKRETTYNRLTRIAPWARVLGAVYLASVKFSLKELSEALEAVKFPTIG